MVRVRATLVGERELVEKLRRMGPNAKPLVMAALHAGALLIQNDAKRLVPKRTRTLSRSIVVQPDASSTKRLQVCIGPTVEYGLWVEMGTGKYAKNGKGRKTPWAFEGPNGEIIWTAGSKPKPYMRPAFDENRDKALEEFKRVLRNALEAM